MINSSLLYELKLKLDYLEEDEYSKISKDVIGYIEDNAKYDEKIKAPSKAKLKKNGLENEDLKLIEKILKQIDKSKKNKLKIKDEPKISKQYIDEYLSKIKKDNEVRNLKIEVYRAKALIEKLEDENKKIDQAKNLLEEYNKLIKGYEVKISKLKDENTMLNLYMKKIPRLVKNIFVGRRDQKLLNGSGK